MKTIAAQPGLKEGWQIVDRLSSDVGPRVAGTDGEIAARAIIVEEFRRAGFEPREQPFRFVGWRSEAEPTVTCCLPDGSEHGFSVHHLGYTQSIAGITGPLRLAGVCQLVDGLIEWPRLSIQSDSGESAFIAVIPDGASRPFARPERHAIIPPATVIVGSDEFSGILQAVASGANIIASVAATGSYQVDQMSANVIVDLPGENTDEVVIVGAHYDSVPNTPGAGDNASGVGGCLALAHRFKKQSRARSLRFVLWGAHEVGLLGSQAYVLDLAERQNLDSVTAAVALDILSDGDRLGVWTGGPQLQATFPTILDGLPQTYPLEAYDRLRGETDSWSFAERGVDTAMFLTLPYSRFHLPEDMIENNDLELFRFSIDVADRLVQYLLDRPLATV